MGIPRKVAFASVSLVALAAMVGVACGGGAKTGPAPAGGAEGAPDLQERSAAANSPAPGRSGLDTAAVLSRLQLPALSQRVIKTASVTLLVRKGTFQQR